MTHLIIRADAGLQMGAGHVMRMLALAQAWQDRGGHTHLLSATLPTPLQRRLLDEQLQLVPIQASPGSPMDAKLTARFARSKGQHSLLLDGYHFTPDYHIQLRKHALSILAVDDDAHLPHYQHCQLILNQNITASHSLYPTHTPQDLMLGPLFTLLRREFRNARPSKPTISSHPKKILLTLGGSDPLGLTPHFIQLLNTPDFQALEVSVVIGGATSEAQCLGTTRSSLPDRFIVYFDVKDMTPLMLQTDIAITAAGSTCWELAALGVPMATIVVADNQRAIAQHLSTLGISLSLGEGTTLDPQQLQRSLLALLNDTPRRQQMSDAGRQLLDGAGADRVIARLLNTSFLTPPNTPGQHNLTPSTSQAPTKLNPPPQDS